jgi:hypothetical protein
MMENNDVRSLFISIYLILLFARFGQYPHDLDVKVTPETRFRYPCQVEAGVTCPTPRCYPCLVKEVVVADRVHF